MTDTVTVEVPAKLLEDLLAATKDYKEKREAMRNSDYSRTSRGYNKLVYANNEAWDRLMRKRSEVIAVVLGDDVEGGKAT